MFGGSCFFEVIECCSRFKANVPQRSLQSSHLSRNVFRGKIVRTFRNIRFSRGDSQQLLPISLQNHPTICHTSTEQDPKTLRCYLSQAECHLRHATPSTSYFHQSLYHTSSCELFLFWSSPISSSVWSHLYSMHRMLPSPCLGSIKQLCLPFSIQKSGSDRDRSLQCFPQAGKLSQAQLNTSDQL